MKMLKTLRLVETESEVTVSLDVSGRNINIEMSYLDKDSCNKHYSLSDLIYPILSLRDAAEAVVKEAEKSFSDKEDDFENGLTLI